MGREMTLSRINIGFLGPELPVKETPVVDLKMGRVLATFTSASAHAAAKAPSQCGFGRVSKV
jgi:hypothetical protein